MKTRSLRVLGAMMAALLPACGGGGGENSGSEKPKKSFAITLKSPKAGTTYTAPATISLKAVARNSSNVATMEFLGDAFPGQDPDTWFSRTVISTLTQPPFQAIWTEVPAGIHTIVAVATDASGTRTFSNTVTINVLPPGGSPGGWTPIAQLWDPGRVWFNDAKRGWTAGAVSILHTGDGGATWVTQFGGPKGCLGCLFLNDIQFVDAKQGWAVGGGFNGGMVFRTTDGGATWTPSSVGKDTSFFALSFVDSDTGWVGGIGGIFATKDGGVSWTPLPTGIAGAPFIHGVHFVDRQNGWILETVVTPTEVVDTIQHSTDGGLTWTEQFRTESIEVSLAAIEFVSATTGWVSRISFSHPEKNRILHTEDGGATWTEQTYPGGGFINALDFISPTEGWGVGDSNTILHTEDGGQSWEAQQTGVGFTDPPITDVHFIDANRGWAIRADGILLKTTTGGKSP